MDVRSLLRQVVNLLTLQLKGETTFMADINSELLALKDAVTAETDQDAALGIAIDGAVSTIASGVAEIKALAQQLLTVANDPQMVRDLAAQLKAATDSQASKLAALQAASGDLASAVTANTTGDNTSSSGDTSSSSASSSGSGAGTGVPGSDSSSGVSAGGTAPASGENGSVGPATGNDTAQPTSQEDVNEALSSGEGEA